MKNVFEIELKYKLLEHDRVEGCDYNIRKKQTLLVLAFGQLVPGKRLMLVCWGSCKDHGMLRLFNAAFRLNLSLGVALVSSKTGA